MMNDDVFDGPAKFDEAEVPATTANNQGKPALVMQPEKVAHLLDSLPGIIGGIDMATKDRVGHHVPFVLLYFTGNAAVHATNAGAREAAMLIVEYAKQLAASDPELAALLKGE
jgi:hypothetical protein